MCHACVVDHVSQRMLSRRRLFRGAAAAGAAVAVAPVLAPLARAQTPAASQVSDLTHTLHEGFPTFFNEQQFWREAKFTYAEHKFNLSEWRVNEHTGTHMDAPLHFSADGDSVDAIAVDRLVCPLSIVDIRAKAAQSADAEVTPDDLTAWMSAHGPLPAGGCVAMLSGWSAKIDGPEYRNADAEGKMHFPGFHVEAAQMLIEDGNTIGIAVDTLSLDFGMSPDFASHYEWLPSGRWGLECVANLDALPATGATLVVGAPKVRGGSGGPTRVFALL